MSRPSFGPGPPVPRSDSSPSRIRASRLLWALVLSFTLATPALAENAADGGTSSDGGVARDAGGAPDAGRPAKPEPCAEERERIRARKEWLAARRQEQFEKGGMPNPGKGIPNMIGVWCDEHPDDEQCGYGSIAFDARPEELVFDSDATPEDRDPHVILMKRELKSCLEREKRR